MVTKAPDKILDALGDGTRRAIVERLRSGPRSVAQLHAGLGVSRPAVSKHLRLMKEAGLVTDRPIGTQRFYQLNLEELAKLQAWVDRFWDTALDRFKKAAEARPPRKEKS
jgi:DNA-binding transcriptional ArsR family regulator